MKTIRKIFVSFAFFIGMGAALASTAGNYWPHSPLWREIPGSGGIMEDISEMCNVDRTYILCSLMYPSSHGRYWDDFGKTSPTGGYDQIEVFLTPDYLF